MTTDNTALPTPPAWALPDTGPEWDSLTPDGGPLAGGTRDVGTDVWIACDDTIEDGHWARSPAAIHYSEEPGQGQGIDAAAARRLAAELLNPQTSLTSTPTDIPLASSGAKGADLRFKSWPVGWRAEVRFRRVLQYRRQTRRR